MHTPYGATECLPVSTIEAAEVLGEAAAKTAAGAGVCVGRAFSTVEWRVIRITDEPIASIEDVEELATGEIGELIVRGPQASTRYVTRTECNAHAKIPDERAGRSPAPTTTWHRMGDVGYLDAQGRFWYCGRKSHRLETKNGTLYTECVEAVFNTHVAVRRSALVGVGPRGRQIPLIVVECRPGGRTASLERELLQRAHSHLHAGTIRHVLFHDELPVDVRHNAKINREMLALWAAQRVLVDETTQNLAPPSR
jgi:acyl-CoA synthetase (AMP-forming)/AMP-acid ligase II